jgi:hypothetical protein
VRCMAFGVGQTIEVCLELDLPPARGLRRVVATFINERGDLAEFTDVPAEASDCVSQEPAQIALQGRLVYPGSYNLERLRVEHLSGVTHVDPPRIGFEVKGTSDVVAWRLS